jgi:hypothetical protein
MGTLYPGNNPPAPSSTSEGGARIVGDTSAPDSPGPFVMSCDTLVGDRVVNRANEELGNIEHLMIDVPTGRIAYAVLACGGVFGIGEKLFAVPWAALTLDAERRCFILDIDRERLAKAPGFDQDHWPAMADSAWASSIHDYYGVRPYWTDRTHAH